MTFNYLAETLKDLSAVATAIIRDAGAERFFIFRGEMGAGKTALIKQMCAVLDVKDEASSPTFSIVNEYNRSNGEVVYHFDFYRINTVSEAFDMGYETYFFSNSYCFVEWPEKIESLLNFPKATIFITLKNGIREIQLSTFSNSLP